MTLSVIGSGFGRTGTMSLKLALERLGFDNIAGLARIYDLRAVLDDASAYQRHDTRFARYATALELQRDFAPGQAGMERVQEVLRVQAFESALAQGAAALVAGRVAAAEAQYQRAATLGGMDARVQEGQSRIAEIRRAAVPR